MTAPVAAAKMPRNGVSLHRQIFLVLRDEIVRGEYPEGALPKEVVLCERFNVSRITVRRALDELASAGLVERRHGRGTFVIGDPTEGAPNLTLAFIDELRRSQPSVKVRVFEIRKAVPPADIAKLLQIGRGTKAVFARRVRVNRRNLPSNLNDVWVPEDLAHGVTKVELKAKPMVDLLRQAGVKFGRTIQKFSATVCDPDRAAILQADIGSPLLTLERLIHDDSGRPVLHLAACFPADRASVLMEMDGASINTLTGGVAFLDTPEAAD